MKTNHSKKCQLKYGGLCECHKYSLLNDFISYGIGKVGVMRWLHLKCKDKFAFFKDKANRIENELIDEVNSRFVENPDITYTDSMDTFFDVGANKGDNSFNKCNTYKHVYAFEPHPKLADSLSNRAMSFKNYHVINKAVSDYNGKMLFNINDNLPGASSLLNYSKNVDKIFATSDVVEVEVITLEKFVQENNIKNISFLHSDVEGCDLEVLLGLGEYLKIVKAGCLEIALNHDVKLYENQKYTLDDCLNFLVSHNFKIIKIKPNDDGGDRVTRGTSIYEARQVNVFYSR